MKRLVTGRLIESARPCLSTFCEKGAKRATCVGVLPRTMLYRCDATQLRFRGLSLFRGTRTFTPFTTFLIESAQHQSSWIERCKHFLGAIEDREAILVSAEKYLRWVVDACYWRASAILEEPCNPLFVILSAIAERTSVFRHIYRLVCTLRKTNEGTRNIRCPNNSLIFTLHKLIFKDLCIRINLKTFNYLRYSPFLASLRRVLPFRSLFQFYRSRIPG